MIKLPRLIVASSLCLLADFSVAEGVSLGDVSNTLLVGGNVLSKVMWAACIIVGVLLIAAAFTQFQIHRRNPKLVPLTTPVMYLLLGICSIAIPFVERVTGFIATPKESHNTRNPNTTTQPTNQHNTNDIDAPLD